MKVVVLDLINEKFKAELVSEFTDLEFVFVDDVNDYRVLKDADVLMGYPNRESFLSAKKLRWLHCPGTGIDKLMGIPELVDSDVVVTNARGPHADPIADHGIAMVLTFSHHLRNLWDDQKEKKWDLKSYDNRMISLQDDVMGIFGLGDIGSAMAKRATAFGMKVYGVDKDISTKPEGVDAIWNVDKLGDLLEISDWFIVAAPYTSETHHVLNKDLLPSIKMGSRLIVLSRGGIVDELALIEMLRSGRISGAALDVTEIEPLPSNSPLWDHPNVVISPHVSALTSEMWDGRREIFKENLRRFLANKPFLYTCDKHRGY